MATTRGNLDAAVIRNESTGEEVNCMFNPSELTVSKQNQFDPKDAKGKNVPKVKFRQGGAQTLRLQLFFDTYADAGNDAQDVRECTQGLWDMMMVVQDKKHPKSNKSEPPRVEFRWGKFSFRAVITNISQKFTLFKGDGTPVRTTVDITFQQVEDEAEHARQNPTSGGGPPQKVHIVQSGDRLDSIAARVYGDAGQWRLIASENRLVHPLRLRAGQQLVIPPMP